MSAQERALALQRYAAKRNERKRQKRAAGAAHVAESSTEEAIQSAVATVLSEIVEGVAEVCDKVDEEELKEELERRVVEQFGEAYLMDTCTRDTIELELRMEGYGAARGDDGRQVYSLPHAELQRRVAEGELAMPGEDQMVWDQRVLRDRLARGALLGAYLEELQRLLHEPPCDPIADHVLTDYSGELRHWKPQGTETALSPPPAPHRRPPAVISCRRRRRSRRHLPHVTIAFHF